MKRLSLLSLLLFLFCSSAFAQSAASNGFRTLHVDAGQVIGEIRSFQGVNGSPAPVMAGLPNLERQFKDLRVDQVRTHDLMGPTEIDSKFEYTNTDLADLIPDSAERAGVVKSGNAAIIFPDASADPEKPESYNFGPTDKVLAAIHETGAEIYYRIGRSWGADTNPPADFDKYSSVVKHIAMHYNQGWDNGFHWNIRYWEFWNEPDGFFWTSKPERPDTSPEQFYLLYAKTALALKSVDPTLKVGGDAVAHAGAGPYREGFIEYCAAHKLPLDFYSWHTYASYSADPYDAVRLARQIRGILDTNGFQKAESILSEWNLSSNYRAGEKAELESAHNAAYIGAVMSYFQDAPLDMRIFIAVTRHGWGSSIRGASISRRPMHSRPWAKCWRRRSGWRSRVLTRLALRRWQAGPRMGRWYRLLSAIMPSPRASRAGRRFFPAARISSTVIMPATIWQLIIFRGANRPSASSVTGSATARTWSW